MAMAAADLMVSLTAVPEHPRLFSALFETDYNLTCPDERTFDRRDRSASPRGDRDERNRSRSPRDRP